MVDTYKFSDIFSFQKKSKIKAGDGLKNGLYPFFTSSPNLTKRYKEAQFDGESLIFGTGGMPSIHYCNNPFAVSTDCLVAQPKKNIEVKFVYYFLLINIWILENGFKGAGLKHISKSYISDIDIPLPSLEEQKRIVRILDQADSLRQKRQKAISLLDDYLKAVFLEMFGDPVKNPKGWEKIQFNDLCLRLSDGPFGSKLKTEHYSDEGIRVVRLQNIGVGAFKNYESYVRNDHYEKELVKYTCYSGDIVIATLGDPNIRACIIPDYIEKAVHKADCVHCVPKDTLNKEFLINLLNLPEFHHFFEEHIHGQTRSRISSGQLKKVMIPVPPIEIQKKFAMICEIVERTKQFMATQSKELDTNFNALMQVAFN